MPSPRDPKRTLPSGPHIQIRDLFSSGTISVPSPLMQIELGWMKPHMVMMCLPLLSNSKIHFICMSDNSILPQLFSAIFRGQDTISSVYLCNSCPSRLNSSRVSPLSPSIDISGQIINPLFEFTATLNVVQLLLCSFTLNWLINSPLAAENFWIRPLPVSATYRQLLLSIAIPVGELNVPLPFPGPPIFRMGSLLLTKIWVCWLLRFCAKYSTEISWLPLLCGVNATTQLGCPARTVTGNAFPCGSLNFIVRKHTAIGTVLPSSFSNPKVSKDSNPAVVLPFWITTLVGKIDFKLLFLKWYKFLLTAVPSVAMSDVKHLFPVWNAAKSISALSVAFSSFPVMYIISLIPHVFCTASEWPMYLSNTILAWWNRSCSSSKVRCFASYCCKMAPVTSCSYCSISWCADCITERRSFITESLSACRPFISDSIWWTTLLTLVLVTRLAFSRSLNKWRRLATASVRLTMECSDVFAWSTTVQWRHIASLQVSQKKNSGWLPCL